MLHVIIRCLVLTHDCCTLNSITWVFYSISVIWVSVQSGALPQMWEGIALISQVMTLRDYVCTCAQVCAMCNLKEQKGNTFVVRTLELFE